MNVAIVFPPILKDGKYPLLGQNRQFRYSSSHEVRIYPIVPATAATLLKREGFDVLYLDGINERLSMEEFLKKLDQFKPNLILIETKTPIVQKHWNFIDKLKSEREVLCVLVGDHVSALPEESLLNSSVDYVISGGDYDFTLLKLCQSLECDEKISGGGIWYKQNGRIINTGLPEEVENLDELPFIDRELTRWDLYGEAYLYNPCTYIMSGRGCGRVGGVGVCKFCSWQHNLWGCKARLRSPENVAKEIELLIERYKVNEVFDDNESGAVWNKKWLEQFHIEMKDRGLIGEVMLSSNSRADCLDNEICKHLKKTGFRLLKVGLESGNNETLKRIVKKESIEQIKVGVKTAKDHGLIVMLTVMTGYPWETEHDVKKTYEVVKELMLYKTRFGDSLQASVVIPYPGTPLYRECIKKDWFSIDPTDYEKFDMSQPVLKSEYNPADWCDKIWNIHRELEFIVKSTLTLRSLQDLKLAYKGFKSITAHSSDF
ncbi:MAG: B12-binding domain-containing radical SAM protein [Candidatus Hodarchaeales archaeon]|jgi:radical SAM superfamily enzyme YgiQ (UPF0313 family)